MAFAQGRTKVLDGSCEEVMEIGDGSYEEMETGNGSREEEMEVVMALPRSRQGCLRLLQEDRDWQRVLKGGDGSLWNQCPLRGGDSYVLVIGSASTKHMEL